MSIPKAGNYTPKPTPLMTDEQQVVALELLYDWVMSVQSGSTNPPFTDTKQLLDSFYFTRTWVRI